MRHNATKQGATAIYLFIAEINGYKEGTYKSKIKYGQTCYINSKLHNPDVTTEEGRKEFHEDIWLQRLYKDLDGFYSITTDTFLAKRRISAIQSRSYNKAHQWTTPIELDAGASMLQVTGALLNDSRLLTRTNIIGNRLQDAWYIKGLTRLQAKKAATPMLYGSSQACHELWQSNKIKYSLDDIRVFMNELNNGALGVANGFKDFIIRNAKPNETMQVNIDNEVFTIKCNRYKNIGDITKAYSLYDTDLDRIETIYHTSTHKEADLEQFRRYFQTLLIHNLDSQIANKVTKATIEKYGWCIDIHDAFIVNPEAALFVRRAYAREIEGINSRRKDILANYFHSIGIGAEAQGSWTKVQDKIVPLKGILKCNLMALK